MIYKLKNKLIFIFLFLSINFSCDNDYSKNNDYSIDIQDLYDVFDNEELKNDLNEDENEVYCLNINQQIEKTIWNINEEINGKIIIHNCGKNININIEKSDKITMQSSLIIEENSIIEIEYSIENEGIENIYSETIYFNSANYSKFYKFDYTVINKDFCPVAVISESEDRLTINHLSLLSLNGASSYSSVISNIEEYQWVIEGPSEYRFNGRSLDFRGFSPGLYEISLIVNDSFGRFSCEEEKIIVEVLGNNSLIISVFWISDTEMIENFVNGSNLQLRFLHPQGWWGETPWDCNSYNPNPRWTDPGLREDNPKLLIDGVKSRDTEVLSMEINNRDLIYKIGIYLENAPSEVQFVTARLIINDENELVYDGLFEVQVGKFIYVGEYISAIKSINYIGTDYIGLPRP